MQICGRGNSEKEQYRKFGCSAARVKGPTVCTNRASVSELKITAALRVALEKIKAHPTVFPRFAETFERLLKEREPKSDNLGTELARARAQAERVADAILQVGGVSPTLKARLQEAEAKVKALEERRAAARVERPARMPTPQEVRMMFDEALGALTGDPVAGNAVLRGRLARLTLTPTADGWRMRTALKTSPAALLGGRGRAAMMVAGAREARSLRVSGSWPSAWRSWPSGLAPHSPSCVILSVGGATLHRPCSS